MAGICYIGFNAACNFCGVVRRMAGEKDAILAKLGIATLWNADLARGGLPPRLATLKTQLTVVKNFKGALELGEKIPNTFYMVLNWGARRFSILDGIGFVASIFNSISDAAEFVAPCISAAYVNTAKAVGNVATQIGMSLLFVKDARAAFKAYQRREYSKMSACLLDVVRDVSYCSLASISQIERVLGKKVPVWVPCALYTAGVASTALAFCQRNWGRS